VERIPTGVEDLQKFDEPAYVRRGIELNVSPYRPGPEEEDRDAREKIDKHDPEKPAFLRKIMD